MTYYELITNPYSQHSSSLRRLLLELNSEDYQTTINWLHKHAQEQVSKQFLDFLQQNSIMEGMPPCA